VEPVYKTTITKIKANKKFETDDVLVREIKLEIFVNNKKIGAVMATPIDQKALAIGYLMSENIIQDIKDINKISLLDDGTRVEIDAKINEKNLKKLNAQGVVISGCGKSLSANIDPEAIKAKVIKGDFSIKASMLSQKMAEFYTQCELYEQTGCVHTAKLYIDKNTFFIGEDIAQHNTIDKVIAKALLAGADITKSFLMISGRLSSEMVAKAIMHQVPILASRTASTCLGLMIAQKFGLTLVGFVRGNRMNIYKNEGRICV
jgi:FdhD protein